VSVSRVILTQTITRAILAYVTSELTHDATSQPYLAVEIGTQPDDWAAARDLAEQHRALLPAAGERVAVIGCGTSLFMARAIAAAREAAGLGLTDAWPASEHRLARDYDRIIAITRSGTTTEVVEALAAYGGSASVTVVTATAGSPVVDQGEAIVLSQVDERSVVQTRFATTTLALLRWHLEHDLGPVVEQARSALDEPDSTLAAARSADQISFVGMGWATAIAAEAALKLRESTQSWAESYSMTEYRHGPISVSAPGRVVWAFGPLVANFARDVAATGAHLEHRDVDPMADLVRVQRLCLLRAADRGLDPDHPRNLSRSIILD
jgi:fructoselysine-6-P-deglycase FrlB-like protein